MKPPIEPGVTRMELFDPPAARRPFAASDVLRVIVGISLVVVGIVVARVAQSTVKGVEADLAAIFARTPEKVGSLVLLVAQLLTRVVPLVAVVVLLVRRRWKVALLLVLTGFVAFIAMTLANTLAINHDLADVLARLQRRDSVTDATYPSSYVVAATIAVVTVAAPWLPRTWRHVMWWAVGLLLVLRLLAVTYPAFDIVLSIGVGTTVGALVLLVFGSPTNEPTACDLVEALEDLGVESRRIDRRGRFGSALQYGVTDVQGSTYVVLIRTPDERDADLLERTYRSIRFRAAEVDARYSTVKRRLEHEALVRTLADRAGVRVRGVVRIGSTPRGAALLVLRDLPGRPATTDDLCDPDVLHSLWAQVLALHDAGIAHRR
ncbi:MAG TPA: hypothetical protein VIH06_17940, partial [Ilumatobacteraceae bacterium]